MSSKKAQSMSLNVIIVATLALIVLVVLAAIFISKIGQTDQTITKEGQTELTKMKITYGDCRPTASAESQFTTEYSQATSIEAKELVGIKYKEQISRCKLFSDKANCETSGCRWS